MCLFACWAQGGAAGATASKAEAAAALAGTTEAEKIASALDTIAQLQTEANTLRARNHALAEDLFRVTSSQQAPGSRQGVGSPMPGAAMGGGNALGGAAMSASSASLTADVESRVATEMRANRAETEAASLKQQVRLTAANNM